MRVFETAEAAQFTEPVADCSPIMLFDRCIAFNDEPAASGFGYVVNKSAQKQRASDAVTAALGAVHGGPNVHLSERLDESIAVRPLVFEVDDRTTASTQLLQALLGWANQKRADSNCNEVVDTGFRLVDEDNVSGLKGHFRTVGACVGVAPRPPSDCG